MSPLYQESAWVAFLTAMFTLLLAALPDHIKYFLQCCGSGSGMRNRFFLIQDLGSQTHIFESLMTIFWVKSYIILCKYTKLALIFSFASSKVRKFLILWYLWLQKKTTNNCFSPLSFLDVFGSEIRDGLKSGSGINIPDP